MVARRTVDGEPGGIVAGAGGRVYVAVDVARRDLHVFDAPTLAALGVVATEAAPDGLDLPGDFRTS